MEQEHKEADGAPIGDDFSQYIQQIAGAFDGLLHDTVNQRVLDDSPGGILSFQQLTELLKGVKVDPVKLLGVQLDLFQKQLGLLQKSALSLAGVDAEDTTQIPSADPRFKDPAWQESPLFKYLAQAYLLNSEYLESLAEQVDFDDQKVADQFRFALRQLGSSIAPSNFASTNPEIYRAILESKGECLLEGLKNFIADLSNSPPDAFHISQTDRSAFEIGVNIATTPGQVIYQNELMQLIHYQPTTESVYATPLLFVPAIINKFYILDLSQHNSMVKWFVDQGFSVFLISWVNPDESLAEQDFWDYIKKGPVQALDVIKSVSGQDRVHAAGYCIGGTLLAVTQAYLQSLGDHRLISTSYFATLLDFDQPGEAGVFVSEDMIATLEQDMANKGYLDGRRLALSFNLLRENSLFWAYFVNNYLKGEVPAAMDLLYWNTDSTHFPKAACSYYLRHMYLNNDLVRCGLEHQGRRAFLQTIQAPAMFIATRKDHLAPWQSVYQGARAHGGEVDFLLAGSGHIAGIINPPVENKYGYCFAKGLPASVEQWQSEAKEEDGSWWPVWLHWLLDKGGDQKMPSEQALHVDCPVLEPAPGSYVRRTC